MCKFLEKCSVNFRKYRYYYLLQKLEKVVNEDNKINERIKYLNKSAPRICTNNCCNKEFTTCKRKCDLCGSKIVTVNVNCLTDNLENQTSSVGSKYLFIDNKIGNNNKTVMIGEPMLSNPNSYENIDKILSKLKANLKIGDESEWTLLGCDGPPFCIASHLIEKNPDIYDWVNVVSGLGHLNMSQVKTFFKILNKICLEALGIETLKFSSSKPYDYFLN